MTIIYGPNSPKLRIDMWKEIRRIVEIVKHLWIIGGDFNVVRFVDDRLGGDRNNQKRATSIEVIYDLCLTK